MKPHPKPRRANGFALVVTLSLMILLTIMAVGMLSLATISLRTSSQGADAAIARANARMALIMAIGQLQKTAGADQRITAPANLVNDNNPHGLTGVWESWRPDPAGTSPDDYEDRKTGDHFLGYLMSGTDINSAPDPARLPSGSTTVPLVDEGSLGKDLNKRKIDAPVILNNKGTLGRGGCAWVVLDEGVKARIDLEPLEKPNSLGEQVARLGSSPRNRFENVDGLNFVESDLDKYRKDLPKLVSMDAAHLVSSRREAFDDHFHDFTVSSSMLQANVADGGLKTDLSVAFDGAYGAALPENFKNKYVYSDDGSPMAGSNGDPLWGLYANYSRMYRMSSAKDGDPLNGIVARLPSGYATRRLNDKAGSPPIVRYEPFMRRVNEPMLMPTVLGIDMVFSLVTHMAHAGRQNTTYPYQLHMMYLPVITLHNPYNVPLRCRNFKVEFAEVPLGFRFLVNGQSASTGSDLIPMGELYLGKNTSKLFSVILSTDLDNATEVVMGPGETKIFGTPFPEDDTWGKEVIANGDKNKGARMFDWGDNLTGNLKMIPGLITGPNDGIGFDVDWLAPRNQADWVNQRRNNDGVILLKQDDTIAVEFGPLPRTASIRGFTVTTSMGTEAGVTQVVYKDPATLNAIMSEGVSPRFPNERKFPSTSTTWNTLSLYETDNRPFKEYVNARPFAIMSMGVKTTQESFTKGRPLADTGLTFQMATCDFRTSPSQGSSPLEFALVPVRNGGAAIEAGGPSNEMGFFFGGRGSTHGTTAAAIYEVPLAPLQSIAQFRHANGASLGAEPFVTYSVGESRAHPALPSDATTHDKGNGSILLDHSFLANSTMWDRYWFSTLSSLIGSAYSGSAGMSQKDLARDVFSGTRSLPNPRNKPYVGADGEAASLVLDGTGAAAAAHIVTDGGFNVNSTSVKAWMAVLSALSQTDIPLAGGRLESSADTPFPRLRQPAASSGEGDGKQRLWNSYRSLNQAGLKTLAENIVAEVRARGPFLSMAEFVNRRLGAPGDLSTAGAIQAAIDKSDLNSVMLSNARPVSANDVSAYGWENPAAVRGNTGAGSPGEISQGDVLTAIGSFVSVRSDTFRIRAYGDARDASGRVLAKAWCEAVVQRTPEYLDPSDKPETVASKPVNEIFGRRFEVVSFRWLSPTEI